MEEDIILRFIEGKCTPEEQMQVFEKMENDPDFKNEMLVMKNLYVNDELSLTTRPRLGWIKTLGDFSKILYDDGTILFGLDNSEDKKNYKCQYIYKDGEETITKNCSY